MDFRLWEWLPWLLLMLSGETISYWDANAIEKLMKEKNFGFLNNTVDMCSDFHSFTCGNMTESVNLRELSTDWMIPNFSDLVSEDISSDDSPMYTAAKRFYRTCIESDSNQNGSAGGSTLKAVLKSIGVDVADDQWEEGKFNLIDTAIALRKVGVPYDWFFEERAFPKTDITTWASGSAIIMTSKELYIDTLVDIFEELGLGTSSRGIRKDMSDVFEFERRLKPVLEQEMDVHKEEKLRQAWVLAGEAFGERRDCKNTNLCTSRPFDSYSKRHQNFMLSMYERLQNTSERTASNYIALKIIQAHHPFLGQSIRENIEHLRRLSNGGPRDGRTRNEVCLEETKSRFQTAVKTEYMRKHPSSKAREKIQELYEFIKEEMGAYLSKENWMFGIRVLQDLKDHQLLFGLPEPPANWTSPDLEYSGSSNIIEMVLKFSKFYQDLYLDKDLFERWTTERNFLDRFHEACLVNRPLELRASGTELVFLAIPYSYTDDSVLFNGNQPNYFSFANLAIEIVRTMLNYFLLNWTERSGKTTQRLLDENRCILKDYLNFKETLPPFSDDLFALSYDTTLTAHIGYSAFQKWLKNNGPAEPQEPTPQLFFWVKNTLRLCQMMSSHEPTDFARSKSKDKEPPNYLRTYEYYDRLENPLEEFRQAEEVRKSIEKFLVEEAVKNSKDFGKDMNCISRTPMNPEKKCSLK